MPTTEEAQHSRKRRSLAATLNRTKQRFLYSESAQVLLFEHFPPINDQTPPLM